MQAPSQLEGGRGRLAQLEERLRRAEDSLKESEAKLAAKEKSKKELSEELTKLSQELEEGERRQTLLEGTRRLCSELIETRGRLEEG
ncbi:MAG: hypothetical protein ACE5LD_01610, partial [Candidatus Bipolaricaulia bacterium]